MCKTSIQFSLEIQAKPEKVWDILADIEAWPKWQGTDFAKLVTPAPLKEGSKFEAKLGGVRWDLTLTKADRPRSIIWAGKRIGLKAVHGWEFVEQEGKTIASTWETMSGWLMVPLYFLIRRSLPAVDKKWLADLKARAESS
ncbi:MAG TPA: SRPBCC domain-containing protein [Dehalococcoidia bacterium]|nr:SRPBCC domain-containing protein [Dehalococcoidia bacterium]